MYGIKQKLTMIASAFSLCSLDSFFFFCLMLDLRMIISFISGYDIREGNYLFYHLNEDKYFAYDIIQ